MVSSAEALVNTVNTVGVMGKGIALQFKEAFPVNFAIYVQACKDESLIPGKLLEDLLLSWDWVTLHMCLCLSQGLMPLLRLIS